jgi:hypothetical protein
MTVMKRPSFGTGCTLNATDLPREKSEKFFTRRRKNRCATKQISGHARVTLGVGTWPPAAPPRHAEMVADLHQHRDAFGVAGFCDGRSISAGAGIFAPCRPLLGRDADEADEWVTASPEEI